MFKFILSLLLLPACLFGASIPFSGANPTQLGANASTGRLWITNNAQLTNVTVYGDSNRTNALFLGLTGLTVSNAVGSAVTTSGTLTLVGNSNLPMLSVNSTAFIINSNGFISINTNAAQRLVFINLKTNANGNTLEMKSAFTNVNPQMLLTDDLGHNLAYFIAGSGASGATLALLPDSATVNTSGTNGLNIAASSSTGLIRFITAGLAASNERLRIDLVGLVSISNSLSVGTSVWATNGVGSYATTTTVNIGSTGWTNTFGVNAVVYLDGTAVTFSIKNNAGTSIYTNAVSLTGEATVLLQPGGAVITSGTGVAGRATPF